jgi:hypothetical protein
MAMALKLNFFVLVIQIAILVNTQEDKVQGSVRDLKLAQSHRYNPDQTRNILILLFKELSAAKTARSCQNQFFFKDIRAEPPCQW